MPYVVHSYFFNARLFDAVFHFVIDKAFCVGEEAVVWLHFVTLIHITAKGDYQDCRNGNNTVAFWSFWRRNNVFTFKPLIALVYGKSIFLEVNICRS